MMNTLVQHTTATLTEIVDLTYDAIIVADDTGRIILFNRSAEQMFGYLASEVLGQPLNRLLPGHAIDTVSTATRSDQARNVIAITGRHRDGTTFPAEASAARLAPDGRNMLAIVIRGVTAHRDSPHSTRLEAENARLQHEIARHMQTEARLRESEERFRQLAETIHDVFLLISPDLSQIIYVSPAYEAIWGRSRQRLYDNPASYLETIHPEDRDRIVGPLPAALFDSYNEEYRIVRPNGSIRWISARAFPITDGNGRVYRIAAVVKDISARKRAESALQKSNEDLEHRIAERTRDLVHTNSLLHQEIAERRQAETALRESEERYRGLVELSPDAILVSDPQERILFSNQKWLQIVGATSADHVIGRPVSDFIIDGWQHNNGRHTRQTSSRQRADPYVHKLRRLDGELLDFELTSVTIHYQGTPATLSIGRDITERRQIETMLHAERALLTQRVAEHTAELSAANAQLARAARLKDEFLASMSHELRTPLNVILGQAEVLLDELYGPLDAKQARAVQMIGESGQHLLALINDILDIAKIEAGKVTLELQPIEVDGVCRASIQLVKQMAQKKALEVHFTSDSTVTIFLADGRRLKQILVNLLSNAIKFTPEGGQIGLEVRGDSDQTAVHFTVWDTGIGIAADEMDRLFQPFVQLDSGLDRQHQGTGLGLSLVRRLADMHGGSISLESKVGRGSRFTVSLPWRTPPSLEDTDTALTAERRLFPSPMHMSAPSAATILLVEDNEANIETMADYLIAKGYYVVIARSGNEALVRATEEYPDLILMDIQMPGMDGVEAIRYIRGDPKLAGIPIIALTALAMPGDREHCLQAGATDYVSKPVSLQKLMLLIETHLPQHQVAMSEMV